ncbi:MAG: sulfate adenylyltransferase [Anaerolineae bacterium]|nr:sulfate adenylyltransferase [Anaerolineae bacterium]
MTTVPGIQPHGGALVNRALRGVAREGALEKAKELPQLVLTPTSLSDIELIACGAMSPLTGFMVEADYRRVVHEMRLSSGVVWSIPITLPTDAAFADAIDEGDEIALCQATRSGTRLLATMEVQERYTYDKATEAREVYRTTDEAHPGVARLYAQGDVLLGGPITLLDEPEERELAEFRYTPAQTRRMFASRGWQRTVGFQTRNPIHRAHEYIQKAALEIVDGLFLHPLVGETKQDDIPAEVRIKSYEAVLRDYYPADRVLLAAFPATMRYAGPREAVFHALCRKNYGCTHFIVGRDHAGVGNYYGTYDAQRIFDEFAPEDVGIIPLLFEHAFYCRKCGTVVTAKTCPHGKEDWLYLSGTQLREMLARGEAPPPEFTRPEVAQILIEGYKSLNGKQRTDG